MKTPESKQTPVQTATKQPQGADQPKATLSRNEIGIILQMILDVGDDRDGQTPEEIDIYNKLKPLMCGGAISPENKSDWAEAAADEIGGVVCAGMLGAKTPEGTFAAIIRKHAPLVANREDSERDSKRLDWLSREICYEYALTFHRDMRKGITEFFAGGPLKGTGPSIRAAIDAAMRPAQPERGQGEEMAFPAHAGGEKVSYLAIYKIDGKPVHYRFLGLCQDVSEASHRAALVDRYTDPANSVTLMPVQTHSDAPPA